MNRFHQHSAGIYLDPKYADDITYLTTIQNLTGEIKVNTAHRLKKFNLSINETKTEDYEVPGKKPAPPPPPPPTEPPKDSIDWSELDWLLPPKTSPPEPEWKKCKLLGSKIDTKADIENRKAKTWEPIKLLKPIFKSKRISTALKIRAFQTYVEPALLYNAELWTLTSTLENQLNAFHRRLLRIALDIHYPKTINTKKLYAVTKTQEISITIKRRRLNLFGHILRLHPDTPAQIALKECTKPQKRPRGHPPLTWLKQIMNDLSPALVHHNIGRDPNTTNLNKLTELASVRSVWRGVITRSMGEKSAEKTG